MTKYISELLQVIKTKMVGSEFMTGQLREQVEQRFGELKQEYFENMKAFKHLSSSKPLQTIVNFI